MYISNRFLVAPLQTVSQPQPSAPTTYSSQVSLSTPTSLIGKTHEGDILRSLFRELHLVDEAGLLNKWIKLPSVHFVDEELKRLDGLIYDCFKVCNAYFDFGIKINIVSVLLEFRQRVALGLTLEELIPVLLQIEEMETVGSVSLQIAGLSYIMRYFEALLRLNFSHLGEEKIQATLKSIFTERMRIILEKKLSRPLPDVDVRTLLRSNIDPKYHQPLLYQILNIFVKIFSERLPPLSEEAKRKAVLALEKKCPDKKWDSLKPGGKFYSDFSYHLVKNLAFEDLFPLSGTNVLAEAKIGDHNGVLVDFVNALHLTTDQLFPQMKIPFSTLLRPPPQRTLIIPTGDPQAILDELMDVAHPPIENMTDANLKGLMVREIKGKICPYKNFETRLCEAAKKTHSQNPKNPYVLQMSKNHPEIKENLQDYFSHYVLLMLQDVVDKHFKKSPHAAIIATLIACRQHKVALGDKLDFIIEGMSKYWSSAKSIHPHLLTLVTLVEDQKIPLSLRLNLISCCLFARVCLEDLTQQNPDEVCYHVRVHNGFPFVEISYPVEQSSYHLLMDVSAVDHNIEETIKGLSESYPLEQQEKIVSVITLLTSKNTNSNRCSSKIIPDLPYFNFNHQQLENSIYVCFSSQSLLLNMWGLHLMQLSLTLTTKSIPLDSFLKKGPQLLHYYPHEVHRLRHVVDMSGGVEMSIRLFDTIKGNDLSSLSSQWIFNLFQLSERERLGFELWEEFCSSEDFTLEDKKNLTNKVVNHVRKSNRQSFISIIKLSSRLMVMTNRKRLKHLQEFVRTGLENPTQLIHELFSIDRLLTSIARYPQFHEEIKFILEIIPEKLFTPHLQRLKNRLLKMEEDLQEKQLFEREISEIKSLTFSDPVQAKERFITFYLEYPLYSEIADLFYSILLNLNNASQDAETYDFVFSEEIQKLLSDNIEALQRFAVFLNSTLIKRQLIGSYQRYVTIVLMLTHRFHSAKKESKTIYKTIFPILERNICSPHNMATSSLKKELSSCLYPFLMALRTPPVSDNYCIALDMCAQLGLGQLVSAECKKWGMEDLLVLAEGSTLSPRMVTIAENLIVDHIASFPSSNEKVVPLLMQLALKSNLKGQRVLYLNLLSKVKPLSNEGDLSFLIELMNKELKENLTHSVMLLKFFKGPVLPSKDTLAFYLSLLSGLKNQNNYSELCTALVLNPFITKECGESFTPFVSAALRGVLDSPIKISPSFYPTLFTLLSMYSYYEGKTLIELFGQLEEMDVPLLSEKMWEFMESMPDVLSEDDLSNLWVIVLRTLKSRSKKALIKLIENDEGIRNKLRFISKKSYVEVFDSVWSAWVIALKKTQNNQSSVYIDKFIHNFDAWILYFDKENAVYLLEKTMKSLNILLETKDKRLFNLALEKFEKSEGTLSTISKDSPVWDHVRSTLVKLLNSSHSGDNADPQFIERITKLTAKALDYEITPSKLLRMITLFSDHPTEAGVDMGLEILERYLKQPQIPPEDLKIIREVNTRQFLDRVFLNVGGDKPQQILNMVTQANFHRITNKQQRSALAMFMCQNLNVKALVSKNREDMDKAIETVNKYLPFLDHVVKINEENIKAEISCFSILQQYFECLMLYALEYSDFKPLEDNLSTFTREGSLQPERERIVEIVLNSAEEAVLSCERKGKLRKDNKEIDDPVYNRFVRLIFDFIDLRLLSDKIQEQDIPSYFRWLSAFYTRLNTQSYEYIKTLPYFLKKIEKLIQDPQIVHVLKTQIHATNDTMSDLEWYKQLSALGDNALPVVLSAAYTLQHHFDKNPSMGYALKIHKILQVLISRTYPYLYVHYEEVLPKLLVPLMNCAQYITNNKEASAIISDNYPFVINMICLRSIRNTQKLNILNKCFTSILTSMFNFEVKVFLLENTRKITEKFIEENELEYAKIVTYYSVQTDLLLNMREQIYQHYNIEANKLMPPVENDPLVSLTLLEINCIYSRFRKIKAKKPLYFIYYDLVKYLILDSLRKRNLTRDTQDRSEIVFLMIKTFLEMVCTMKDLHPKEYQDVINDLDKWTKEFTLLVSSTPLQNLTNQLNAYRTVLKLDEKRKGKERKGGANNYSPLEEEKLEIQNIKEKMNQYKMDKIFPKYLRN